MKKLLKIFMYLIISIFSLIIILIVVANIAEDEITQVAVKKLSKAIDAPLEIDHVSLTLIKRFPFATIEFNGVWLGTPAKPDPNDSAKFISDTIARIDHLYISVKTRPLLNMEFEVKKVEIRDAEFNYLVDAQGVSNIDFLLDTTQTEETDTSSTPLNVILQDLVLKNITCNYNDSSLQVKARLTIPQIKVKGEIEDERYEGSVKGNIELSECSYASTNLYLMEETELKFNLDYADNSVSINDLEISTDGADMNVSGRVYLSDGLSVDLDISETEINLGDLIKYAPEQMIKEYGIKKVSGIINLEASVKGAVSDSLLPHVEMSIKMKDGSIVTSNYPSVKKISFTGQMTNGFLNNNSTTRVDISSLHLETNQSKLDLTLSLQNIDHPKYYVNTSLDIMLQDFEDFIPDTLAQNLRGQIKASITTKGELPDSIGDDFVDYVMESTTANFDFINIYANLDSSLSIKSLSGQVLYKPNHITLKNFYVAVPLYNLDVKNTSFDAYLSGKLSDMNTMGIDLRAFQIETDGLLFNGSAKLKNLNKPNYSINSHLKLNLDALKNMIPDTLVNDVSGLITAHITSSGKIDLDSIADQINDIIFKQSSAHLSFNNVSVEMPDTLMNVANLSGEINIIPDTITISKLQAVFNKIDFSIDSTKIINLYESVIKNQASQLYVEGRFNLGDLNYNMFLPFMPVEEAAEPAIDSSASIAGRIKAYTEQQKQKDITPEPPPVDTVITNWRYLIKGKLTVNSFTYNKALVENISAKFNLTDTLYIVDQFKFNAFGGKHNTSVKYIIKDEEETIWVKNSVRGMNVNQLLKDFDNFVDFYEPAITKENISGIFTSNLDAQILFRNDTMVMDKFFVKADTIKLEKGVISNYQPVQDVAQYLPGIDNLEKLEFKTINSQVFILQGAIYVPTTVIVSNKLDASALGMQSFEEDYSYHFIVFLSDILSGKKKKVTKNQAVSDDEITLLDRKGGTLVKSYSLDGKSRSGLDSKEAQIKMKSTVSAAHTLLKLKFYPQLVKYDTGVK